MPCVTITLFGEFRVATESGSVDFPTLKTESLLSYLLLHPGEARRDRLAVMLWPDLDEGRSKRNLSTTLWRLKAAIAEAPSVQLIVDERCIQVACENVEVDALRFKKLLNDADHAQGMRSELLRQAEALYVGDLLENNSEAWCEEDRRYLQGLYSGIVKELATKARESGNYRVALGHLRKVVDIEPLDEDAQRELMLVLYLTGNRNEALSQFERMRRQLKSELGVKPSHATLELWEYIRSHPAYGKSPTKRLGTWTGDDSLQSPGTNSIPMFGRNEMVLDLLGAVDRAARGEGGAAMVSAEAGFGKTKLVEAIAAEAGLRGFDILSGQCPEVQDPRSYYVFVQALWPRMSDSRWEATAASGPLLLLRGLAPDSQVNNRPDGEPTSASYNSAIVVEAFLTLFAGKYAQRPTLLILEDIHRIDKASASVLVTLLERLSKLRLFILATKRSEYPDSSNMSSIFVAHGAKEIRMEPLDETETGKLIRAALHSSSVSNSVIRYVWGRSHGVPLFVLEFVKYLQDERMLRRDDDNHWILDAGVQPLEASGAIPSRVQEVVKRRIEALGPECKKVLQVAAAFGQEIDFDVLRKLVGSSEDALVDATDKLVGLRLLIETDRGFRFSHELIKLVAASMLGRARLRVIHATLARLVERSTPWNAEDLAWHYEEAGNAKEASNYAEAAGDKARSVHANADAVSWYSKAMGLLDRSSPPAPQSLRHRATLLQKRQEALEVLGDREGQAADIVSIHAIARQMHDKRLLAESLLLRANLLVRINAPADALKSARSASRRFRRIRDLTGVARAREVTGVAYENMRRYSLASAEFGRSLRMFRQVGDLSGEARGLMHLGVCHAYRNRDTIALRCLTKAEDLLRSLGDRRAIGMVDLQRGIVYRYLGQLVRSEYHLLRGVTELKGMGDRVGEARGLGQLACTHAALGRLRESIHECETALRIARQAKDVRALIMILNNAAFGVYRLTGGYLRGERYANEAMRLVADGGNVENPAAYGDTMAAILVETGRLNEALQWARQSEARYSASGYRTWIGIDIRLTLGSILLELGRPREAMACLRRAKRDLGRNREPASELLIQTGMAMASLQSGNMKRALGHERCISALLNRVDGVEQIQRVYWTQFQILRKAGRDGAARRALRRAVFAIVRQASTLKGPIRTHFLASKVNTKILHELLSLSRSVGPGRDKRSVKELLRTVEVPPNPDGLATLGSPLQ